MKASSFMGNVIMISALALPNLQTSDKKFVKVETYDVVACMYEKKIYYDFKSNGYGLDMTVEFSSTGVPARAIVADDIKPDNYFVNLHLKPRPRVITFVPRDSTAFDGLSKEYASINPENGQRKPF